MQDQPLESIVIVAAIAVGMGGNPLPQQLPLRVLVAIVVVAPEDVNLEIWGISKARDLMATFLARAAGAGS